MSVFFIFYPSEYSICVFNWMQKFLTNNPRNKSYCIRCFYYNGRKMDHFPNACPFLARCFKCQRPVKSHPNTTAKHCKYTMNPANSCKYCWIQKASHRLPNTSGTVECIYYNTDILKHICWLLWLEKNQETIDFILTSGVTVGTDEEFFYWILRATRPGGQLLNGVKLAYEFAKDMPFS